MAVTVNGSTGVSLVQDNVIVLADLTATGTASATTFLRGDNAWVTIGVTFPFYKADGSSDTIAVTNGEFPFFKADGSADNIGVS